MKHTSFAFVALAGLSIAACSTQCGLDNPQPTTGSSVSQNSNITVLQAAQSLTDGIFAKESPVVSAATKNLPEPTQVMIQAAFAALQKGIDEAEATAWDYLPVEDQHLAQDTLDLLISVRDKMHVVIHDSNVVVPPTLPLQDPNGTPVAVPVPVADPNATVTVDPNQVTLGTTATELHSVDPCSTIILPPQMVSPSSAFVVSP